MIRSVKESHHLRGTAAQISPQCIYYDISPKKGYRIVILDCFDVNPFVGSTEENRLSAIELLNRENCYTGEKSGGETVPLWRAAADGKYPALFENYQNYKEMKPEKLHYQSYNGGLSSTQLQWLKEVLRGAQESGEIVIVCGHLPIHKGSCRADAYLYNHEEVIALFRQYKDCVKVYLAGHDHGKDYYYTFIYRL